MSFSRFRMVFLTASLSLVAACSTNEPSHTGAAGQGGGAGTTGTAGSGNPGAAGSTTGAAGNGGPGAAGTGGGAAGTGGGVAGTNGGAAGTGGGAAGTGGGAAGTGGGAAGTGGGAAGTGGGAAGTGGGAAGTGGGAAGTGGGAAGTGAGGGDPPAPRAINVQGTGVSQGNFNGQPFYFNKSTKPVEGKLVLFLGGIGGGPGSGGFDAFTKKYGFHIFMPKTNTNLTGCSGSDPKSAGYRRWSLWDGMDHGFGAPAADAAMANETVAFIKSRMDVDPDSDWGYFLNADGTLRTTDVYVVGYSWGAQTWAMVSQYVRFGRVIVTAGPVDEGCPNAAWMTDRPSATPDDRKYALIDQQAPWPGEMNAKFKNVMKAGWVGPVTNVTPNLMPATFTADQHLFAMIGGNGGISPGGHTVFCTDNPANGWLPVCKHVHGREVAQLPRFSPFLAWVSLCAPLGCQSAMPATAGTGAPEVFYDRPLMKPRALQADADSLYWIESRNTGSFLVKAPLAQTTPPATPVDLGEAFGGDTQTQVIAVDATTVYWRYDESVRKVPKDGGTVTTIPLGAGHINGLVVERGDNLYVADHGCLAIGKVPKAGGAVTYYSVPPHANPGRSTSLAVDDAYVYCGGGKIIYRAPQGGPDATPFQSDQELVGAILPTKDKLFWVNNKSDLQSRQENLATCAIAGGASQSLGVVGGQCSVMLLDEKRKQLYTITGGGLNAERVLSYGLEDGALKPLASNLTTRWALAQDDQYLYWAGDMAIMRIAKP